MVRMAATVSIGGLRGKPRTQRTTLASGTTDGHAAVTITADTAAQELGQVSVTPGDMISLVVGPKGAHPCDTTIISLEIARGGRAVRGTGI